MDVAMSRDHGELGWHGRDRDAPDVVAAREYLEAKAGLADLEILTPADIEHAVRLFRRDGFVVIADALTPTQTDFLRAGVVEVVDEIVALDHDRSGNRGSHRYSFGGSSVTRSMLHRPEWQMLIDLPTVTPIVRAIFESSNYMLRAASGDFCLPGAVEYQPLHSDMRDSLGDDVTKFSSFRAVSFRKNSRNCSADLPPPSIGGSSSAGRRQSSGQQLTP